MCDSGLVNSNEESKPTAPDGVVDEILKDAIDRAGGLPRIHIVDANNPGDFEK